MRPVAPLRVLAPLLLLFVAATSACGGRREASSPPTGSGTTPATAASHETGRLIILGFDGVDPRWLEQWSNEGKLPNLTKLMKAHGGRAYRPLASTIPPQSPVAWTTFATGTQPGGHGIYDFIRRALRREPGGLPVTPDVATTVFEPRADGPPVARNLRTGEPFWKTLADAEIPTLALNVPYSFPPDPMREGQMLSGLGVPDLRETNSTFTYADSAFTDAELAAPPGGGALVRARVDAPGRGSFDLEGPSIPGTANRMAMPITIASVAEGARIEAGGRSVVAALGAWSDWLELSFRHESLEVQGIARFIVFEVGARVRVFVSPLSFHPRAPYSPITYPNRFAAELADALGHVYKTVGWDHDTSSLNAELVDDAHFLADMDAIERDRKAMLDRALARDDWRMLIWVSTATDRVAHMFYRLIDPQHPRYDAALAARHGDAIRREYERMDRTVGDVLARLRPNDRLLILSDHGFHNYRRGLHVNQWLRENGYLALKDGATHSDREFLLDVDWSNTRAYALGTGQIYLNVRGREREGAVNTSQAAALAQEIRAKLRALRDAERGDAVVVREVYVGREVFRGARAADAPDMQIAFAENYRTSWESILGGVPAGLFADNMKKWSGDHSASDVAETPGILIANAPIVAATPGIVDVAPTALTFFGIARPSSYEGRSFLVEGAR